MPEGGEGGGGPRDEVGTLNVCTHPTWGSLNNARKMLAQGSGSLNNVKTMKATTVLNVGNLYMSVLPSLKYPEFPEVRTCFPLFP